LEKRDMEREIVEENVGEREMWRKRNCILMR
jgi:hypothetical protein